jgi:hypothetical protein
MRLAIFPDRNQKSKSVRDNPDPMTTIREFQAISTVRMMKVSETGPGL